MEARPSSGRGSLFLSVDYAYKRNDLVIFSFLPIYAIEARAYASKVAAHIILKYQANEAIYEYFTPDACLMAEDVEWDEATQTIVTKEEKYLDNLIALEDDLWLFDGDELPSQTTTVQITGTPTRIESIFLGNCDDSVGTLRSNVSSRAPNPTRFSSRNSVASTGQVTTISDMTQASSTGPNTESVPPSNSNQSQSTRRFAHAEASVNQWVSDATPRTIQEPPLSTTASRSHQTTSGSAS
jgi:hypothetical protein